MTQFGAFDLLSSLSRGGMGEVYLARQRVLDRDRLVIVKTLLPQLASEPGFVEQFLDEARTTTALNHPNIVSVYDVGEIDGVYYISMEFIRGVDLAKLRRRAEQSGFARIPLPLVLRVIHDAAVGLHHAHTATDDAGAPLCVVHRDVSPQNLMIRLDGVVKIVDFGIAKSSVRSAGETQHGTLKGKLQYMAPEQVQGLELDARCDQFALGIVFWELVTGQQLFKAQNELETLKLVLMHEIADPRTLAPELPEPVAATVMRMLRRSRDDRFPACDAVAEAIEHYTAAVPSNAAGATALAEFVEAVAGEDVARTPTMGNAQLSPNLEPAKSVARVPPRRVFLGVTVGVAAAAAMGALAVSLRGAPVPLDEAHAASAQLPPPIAPSTAPLPPPTPTPPQARQPTTAPAKEPIPLPQRGPAKRGPRELAPDKRALDKKTPVNATLSLNAIPWAEVAIDGRNLGTTPLFQLPVPAGRHEIIFSNPELKRSIKRSVTLTPNQRKTVVVDMNDEK